MMRVVQCNAWERSGGAARAARRLHRGFLRHPELGVESRVLVRYRESDDAGVDTVAVDPFEEDLWRRIEAHWIAGNRSQRSNTWFSTGRPGTALVDHPWIEEADLVHLHWIPGLLATGDVMRLLELGKPVVWTLHDEWAFTGGCHYTAGCERWKLACTECPQLARDPLRMVDALFADKLGFASTGRLEIVAPSRWLSERAAASAILGGRRAHTIPYGLELDLFTPDHRGAERERLGVREEDLLLLFAASDARERRKGYAELVAALELACRDPRLAELVRGDHIIAVELGVADGRPLPIPRRTLGQLDDDRAVAAVIAACDLYVIPSLEDNLPNGALEALACGTPVAGFASGGIPEIVAGQPLDLLAPTGDAAALADRIALALADPGRLRGLRSWARDTALARWPLLRQARAYAELYERLVASGCTPLRANSSDAPR